MSVRAVLACDTTPSYRASHRKFSHLSGEINIEYLEGKLKLDRIVERIFNDKLYIIQIVCFSG